MEAPDEIEGRVEPFVFAAWPGGFQRPVRGRSTPKAFDQCGAIASVPVARGRDRTLIARPRSAQCRRGDLWSSGRDLAYRKVTAASHDACASCYNCCRRIDQSGDAIRTIRREFRTIHEVMRDIYKRRQTSCCQACADCGKRGNDKEPGRAHSFENVFHRALNRSGNTEDSTGNITVIRRPLAPLC